MRGKKHLFLMIILIVYIITFTTLDLAGGVQTFIRFDKIYEQMDRGYIYITLQHESNPINLPDKELTLKSFEEVYDSLRSSDLYTYYEMYRQPIDITHGSGAFYDETTGQLSENYERTQSIQISENVQHDFDFTTLKGRLLCEEDYHHKGKRAIPILMGFDYSKIYEVGKTFTADYLFSTYSFAVVGFLNDNCNISLSTGIIELDNYIIMPSLEFGDAPKTNQEYASQKIHYANKTSGKIRITSNNYDRGCDYFQSVIQTSKVGEYSWTSSSLAKNMIRNGIDIYLLFPASIALFTVLMLSTLFLTIKYYCVCEENANTSSQANVLTKLCSFIGVLFISNILSLLVSSACLKLLGLAQYCFWSVYCSIAVFFVGALVIILSSIRKMK